jgi:hypothetical protein
MIEFGLFVSQFELMLQLLEPASDGMQHQPDNKEEHA